MAGWLHDGWFAAWHWMLSVRSSLGAMLPLAVGAALSALGGFLARRWEAIRERRATLLLDDLPAFREVVNNRVGNRNPDWEYIEREEFRTLYHRGVASGRRDAKRLEQLERDLIMTNQRTQLIWDEIKEDPPPDRIDRPRDLAMSDADKAQLAPAIAAWDAIKDEWTVRAKERQARVDALHEGFLLKVDEYGEWLRVRLTRVI